MSNTIKFENRDEFRKWLYDNCLSDDGAWLLFGKANGQWDAPKPTAITDEQIHCLSELLEQYEPAFTNFQAMSLSVRKTYTRAYLDAKTDAGREKRIAWMVDRLNKNLKPM